MKLSLMVRNPGRGQVAPRQGTAPRPVRRLAAVVLAAACAGTGVRADVFSNVPEAAGYSLVYTLPIPNYPDFDASIPYSVNNAAAIPRGSFTRVGYYLELQQGANPLQWVYVSFDAVPFSIHAGMLGIPTPANGIFYHYDAAGVLPGQVRNMNVLSNVGGIINGNAIATGNVEFWPSNYGQANSWGVPNANAGTFDFGDGGASTGSGHGAMQIHNYDLDGAGPGTAGQTLFAINRFNAGGANQAALGIGTQPSGDPDWTFNYNSASYTVKNLQIVVGILNSVTWNGGGGGAGAIDGSGTWNAVNVNWWDTAATAWTDSDSPAFGAGAGNGAAGTVTISGTVKPHSLRFRPTGDGNPYTITGGTIDLNDSLIIASAGANATIQSPIVNGGLWVMGDGTLTLSGNNAYSGHTLVTTGRLAVAGGGTLSGSSNFVVQSGSALDIYNGTVTVLAGTGSVFGLGYGATGVATATVANGGTLNIGNGGGRTFIGGGPSGGPYGDGTLVLNAGATVNVAAAGVFPNEKLYLGGYGGNGTVNLNGGVLTSARDIVGANGTRIFNFNGGTLRAGFASTTFLSGMTYANVQAGGAVFDTGANATTIPQTLVHDAALGATPDGGLVKLGTGTLTLPGNNTYSGVTTISNGSVVATHANALGTTSTGTVVIGSNGSTGSSLQMSGSITVSEPLLLIGGSGGRAKLQNASGTCRYAGEIRVLAPNNLASFDANSGTMHIDGNIAGTGAQVIFLRGTATGYVNGDLVYTGNVSKTDGGTWTVGTAGRTYAWNSTAVAVGTFRLGAAGVLPTATVVTMGQNDGNTATLDLNGFDQTIGGLVNNGTTGAKTVLNNGPTPATLTLGSAGNYAYNAFVLANGSGGLSLVKVGSGMQTLGGVNTYTGTTTVSNGTLRINGALAGGGAVLIAPSGKLDGTGTVAGAVTVLSGGRFAAGNSVGTNTVGSLTLTNGATFEVEVDGAAADQTVSLGAVDLGGATLSVTQLSAPTFTSALILSNATGQITGYFAGLGESAPVMIGATMYFIHYRPTYVELNLSPTAVVLHQFGAIAEGTGVVVRWRTASEIRTAGFDLYRKAGGEWVRVNDAPIAATGAPQGGIGASYAITDAGAAAGGTYEYKLVEIEQDGTRREYGPYERKATAFEMTSPIRATPEGMEIRWLSREGEKYRVLRASELRKLSFEAIAEGLEATPPENAFLDTNAAPLRVYRVELDE